MPLQPALSIASAPAAASGRSAVRRLLRFPLLGAAEQRLLRVFTRNGHDRLVQLRPGQATTDEPHVAEIAAAVLIGLAQWTIAAQKLDVTQALGTWQSSERFRNESRVTVAFRKEDRGIVGWATMLGMQRKADANATLGFSFCDVVWANDRFLFKTILPDDEGTTAWEMRLASSNKATLRAVAENGKPIDAPPAWEMRR